MNILEKEYVKAEYLESLKAILLNWYELPDSKKLTTTLFVLREFIEEQNIKNWIVNTSQLYASKLEDEGQVIYAWSSILINAGISNKAIIVSEAKYNAMEIEEIMGTISLYHDYEMRFFPDFKEAKKWIEKMNSIQGE
ncbi:hypothetical protein [Chondrinema litorale]|uniref:hypothetical protein n=1 Tax=Chondrinema litorale TaxID=2994555 RepID=UPI0025439D7D|nr:hypothetical protein [Chondrinema litorale]UZR99906.1 hypothetical protein OQ292_38690 [Chondrinema litorale]